MRRFKENTKMTTLPNTSTLTPEEIQGKLDALVTEVQSHAPSFLGRFSQNKQQRAFIRRFSFQTSFSDPILSLFDAAGVACPHKRNMVDAFTMAVNYALDPAADYTVGQLAKALGLSGKILTSATPISEKCKSRRLTVNNVLRILGKECTNIGLQSAKAIGYFSAANIIARKSITGACDDHAYTYVSYGYGETHQIKTAFVQGEKHPFKSGRETVFSYDSLSSLAGAKCLLPFELSKEDEAKCGFYLGITAKQIREYTDTAIANKKHCKKELALLACLSGFTSYVAEWEELNSYAFEFLELNKALETAKTIEAAKASAEGVTAPEQAPAVETTDKALESAGAKESHEAATVTAPAPKTEAATTESAGAAEQGADPAPLVAYFDQLLSESTEPNDGPETTQEQALQDYFKGMLADDAISGPSESTGAALAPAGAAALTVPATTPTLVPIVANRAAPSILRAVSLGLSPDAGANEEPEALEATPLEATSSHPLAPACGQVTRLSFKYYGHCYRLDYSDKGWRWTFDDYKDQCGRGFCFKADGMTLAEMLKSGLLGTDARYLGELVAYVENEHQINLGQFACHDLEEATHSYVWCRGFGDEDLPAAKLLGVKIYLPIYKSHGRMNLESRFEQADWQIDITAYSAPLLCSAGFSKANAAEFIKGWTNAILWRAEEELDRAQTSATAYDDDYTTDAGDFNDIPF